MENKAEEIVIKEGDYVHYAPLFGKPENGRVKSVKKGLVFVVYKCNNEWEHYLDYTGCATNTTDIRLGWIDDQGNKIQTPENQ